MIQGVTTQIKASEEKIISAFGENGVRGLIPEKDSPDELKLIRNEIREQRVAVDELIKSNSELARNLTAKETVWSDVLKDKRLKQNVLNKDTDSKENAI